MLPLIGLQRLVRAERLLVALDFDGTLASIVPRPESAVIDPLAAEALADLARLPETVLAVLSGRDLQDLHARIPSHETMWLAGSHGRLLQRPAGPLPTVADDPRLVAFRDLPLLRGIRRECKDFSVAFHWRGRKEGEPVGWLRDVRETAEHAGLQILDGRQVLEVLVPGTGKEVALERISRECGATRLLFAGDDRTDLEALVFAQDHGLGVFVYSSERAWMAPSGVPQVPGPQELALLLKRLAAERAAWLGSRGS